MLYKLKLPCSQYRFLRIDAEQRDSTLSLMKLVRVVQSVTLCTKMSPASSAFGNVNAGSAPQLPSSTAQQWRRQLGGQHCVSAAAVGGPATLLLTAECSGCSPPRQSSSVCCCLPRRKHPSPRTVLGPVSKVSCGVSSAAAPSWRLLRTGLASNLCMFGRPSQHSRVGLQQRATVCDCRAPVRCPDMAAEPIESHPRPYRKVVDVVAEATSRLLSGQRRRQVSAAMFLLHSCAQTLQRSCECSWSCTTLHVSRAQQVAQV